MQPETSMAQVERTVRKAIRLLMSDWESKLNAKERRDAAEARERELAKRDGVFASGDLLDYLYTPRIFRFVRESPDVFSPMFGEPARTEALLDLIETVRNATAHGRELVRHERDLMSGIAGLLGNLLVVWQTSNFDVAGNYPVITSVRDSCGREGLGERGNHYFPRTSFHPVRVDVGDEIEITGSATEARGTGLFWHVRLVGEYSESTAVTLVPYTMQTAEAVARGANVRFRYRFTTDDVGERMKLVVAVRSSAEHHFGPHHDDERMFPFAVNPPR